MQSRSMRNRPEVESVYGYIEYPEKQSDNGRQDGALNHEISTVKVVLQCNEELNCLDEMKDGHTLIEAQITDMSVAAIKNNDACLKGTDISKHRPQDILKQSELYCQMKPSCEDPSLEMDSSMNSRTHNDADTDVVEGILPRLTDAFLKISSKCEEIFDPLSAYFKSFEDGVTMRVFTDVGDDIYTSLVDNELPLLEHPPCDEAVSFLLPQETSPGKADSEDILGPLLLSAHAAEEKNGASDGIFRENESSGSYCSFHTTVSSALKSDSEVIETKGVDNDVFIQNLKSSNSAIPIPATNLDSSGRDHEHYLMDESRTSIFLPKPDPLKICGIDSWMNDSTMETLDLSQSMKADAAAMVHGFVLLLLVEEILSHTTRI